MSTSIGGTLTLLYVKKKRTSVHVNSESANERRRYREFSPPASSLAPDVASANQGEGEVKSVREFRESERIEVQLGEGKKKSGTFLPRSLTHGAFLLLWQRAALADLTPSRFGVASASSRI